MKTSTLLKFVSLLILTLTAISLHAQTLEISPLSATPYTTQSIITDVLLGDGISISNLAYIGDSAAIGYFTQGEVYLNMEEGMLLSNGSAEQANQIGGYFASANNNSTAANNDPDIITITNFAVYDASKYLILLVPTYDTLTIRYVWASEEYPEYACSLFNDAFGIFISGPGIDGPYENNGINIAMLPDTNLAVSINNIHPENGNGCAPFNEQYYNDNNYSVSPPVYDGFTTVFTAQVAVAPGQPYFLKLIIGDAGDGIFDSGVFLEAGSLSSHGVEYLTVSANYDEYIVEGCNSTELTFSTLVAPDTADIPLNLSIIGSAENGTDYTFIDTSNVAIPADTNSITISLQAFEDTIDEGTESIGIIYNKGPNLVDTLFIEIRENPFDSLPELGNDTTICQQESIQLDGHIENTTPDYQIFYEWSPIDGLSCSDCLSPLATPDESTSYYLQITDSDGCQATDSINITVLSLPEEPVFTNTDNWLSLAANAPADAMLQWFYNDQPLEDETGDSLCITQSGTYGLMVTDPVTGCSNFFSSEETYNPDVPCNVATTEIEDLYGFRLSPNPFAERLYIHWYNSENTTWLWSLHDLNGRQLLHGQWPAATGAHEESLELAHLPKGVYLLRILTEKGLISQRVVKTE